MSLLAIQDLYDGLSDGLEDLLVDMVHGVGDGMPCRSEGRLLTVGEIGDDVDGGDMGYLVDGDMVVGDGAALILREIGRHATLRCRAPYFLDDGGGELLRHDFLVEAGALSADHVEEDAVAWSVALRDMRCPVLRAESPCLLLVGDTGPLWRAPVLGIETDEVDTDVGEGLRLQQPCDLEHDGDTAGAVVSGHDRLMPVQAVGVVVGPGP